MIVCNIIDKLNEHKKFSYIKRRAGDETINNSTFSMKIVRKAKLVSSFCAFSHLPLDCER